MIHDWLKLQKLFPIAPYEFKIFQIWREAFQAAKPVWGKLIAADIILIIVMHLPFWLPLMGKWFPFLQVFQIHPAWLTSSDMSQKFAAVSILLLPVLFTLFITFPVFMGINLMALRVVYERPAPLGLLGHYITFFWWMHVVALFIMSSFIMVPLIYSLRIMSIQVAQQGLAGQFYFALGIGLFFIILIMIMLSMLLNLVFAARMTIVDAARLSCTAVKMNFWRITGMLVILYLVWNIGQRTWHLSDLVLMPPSTMAWALLYKRIFGQKGLVE